MFLVVILGCQKDTKQVGIPLEQNGSSYDGALRRRRRRSKINAAWCSNISQPTSRNSQVWVTQLLNTSDIIWSCTVPAGNWLKWKNEEMTKWQELCTLGPSSSRSKAVSRSSLWDDSGGTKSFWRTNSSMGFQTFSPPQYGGSLPGGFHSHGGTPIAGWLIMENPSINGWFGGTPISGNLHIVRLLWQMTNIPMPLWVAVSPSALSFQSHPAHI